MTRPQRGPGHVETMTQPRVAIGRERGDEDEDTGSRCVSSPRYVFFPFFIYFRRVLMCRPPVTTMNTGNMAQTTHSKPPPLSLAPNASRRGVPHFPCPPLPCPLPRSKHERRGSPNGSHGRGLRHVLSL